MKPSYVAFLKGMPPLARGLSSNQALNTFMKLLTIGENQAGKTTHRATLLPTDEGPVHSNVG